MVFLVILTVLIAERFLLPYQHLRRLQWFAHWLDWHQSLPIAQGLRQGIPGLLGLLLPPLLVPALAQWLMGDMLAGIPGLLFSALVLLYCLGPEDLGQQVSRLVQACDAGDREQTAFIAARITPQPPDLDDPEFAHRMAEAVLAEAHQRIFGVLVWFLLLGWPGAFGYRLSQALPPLAGLQARTSLERAARRLAYILDWLPARILGGLFALAGCFEPAVQAWRDCNPDRCADAGKALSIGTGAGALQLGSIVNGHDSDRRPDGALAQSAMGLVWRALVLLVTLLGLVTVTGWLA